MVEHSSLISLSPTVLLEVWENILVSRRVTLGMSEGRHEGSVMGPGAVKHKIRVTGSPSGLEKRFEEKQEE